MDLFRRQNSIVTNKRNSDFVQPTMNSMNPQSYGSDSIIKNHFTLIHVYGPLNTDNDYVYQPIQAKQHCYRFVYICASCLFRVFYIFFFSTIYLFSPTCIILICPEALGFFENLTFNYTLFQGTTWCFTM